VGPGDRLEAYRTLGQHRRGRRWVESALFFARVARGAVNQWADQALLGRNSVATDPPLNSAIRNPQFPIRNSSLIHLAGGWAIGEEQGSFLIDPACGYRGVRFLQAGKHSNLVFSSDQPKDAPGTVKGRVG
jgi:hypothetical protein